MNDQWMSLVGLANRARKIVSGEEQVLREIRGNRAKLVLLSADASENTMKKVTDKCKFYKVPYKIIGSRFILGHSIGKEARVTIAICDDGFAKKIAQVLE